MTLRNLRFIALLMMYERYAPEEPTRAPVTMSRSLPSMKPAAAAAHPEYELSIETTTGMSPPPIEATRCQPNARAIAVMISSATIECAATNHTMSPTDTTPARRLSQCRIGSMSGRPEIFAESLR